MAMFLKCCLKNTDMKKYISKPKEPIECSAISVSEENKAEIEKTFKDVLLRFFYHNEDKMTHGHDYKDEMHTKLGCWYLYTMPIVQYMKEIT